jgi:hypothetical protein
VLASEHLLRLAGIHLDGELVERSIQIVRDRLPRFGPFGEDGEIVSPPAQRVAELAIVLEPAPPLQQLLRRRLVLPEVRLRDALFYVGKFFCGTGGVKDSSAGRSRGARGPDTCEAARRVARP